MPVIHNKVVQRSVIDGDRASLLALRQRTDYLPPSADLSIDSLIANEEALDAAEEAEILAVNALAAARAAREAASWRFHNAMLSAKASVIAQYGRDSDVVQEMGLKRLSDYKRRERKKPQG